MSKVDHPTSPADVQLDKYDLGTREGIEQYIEDLIAEFGYMSLVRINGLAGLFRGRLGRLLYSPDSDPITPDEKEALFSVYRRFMESRLTAQISGVRKSSKTLAKSPSKPRKTVPKKRGRKPEGPLFDKLNFIRFIKYLRRRFEGLTIMEMEDHCKMSRGRICSLMSPAPNGCKYIREEEVEALYRLYDGLESGEITYTPDKRKQNVVIRKNCE
ncbi:hypothetical protein KJ742_01930 [Patescibacteria group bacterium]|nr:hypothetical protein [Patescibacteria group bacterium]MBU1682682.1 hypothetical protein [Patescibacteria group bacterium]MBU1935524.1 hypothetical protein [Patescibacteria group bacterium]